MEQEDYIKRQIDQFARVLGKVIANFLGLKKKGQVNQGIEVIHQTLKDELDVDMDELMAIPAGEFIKTLKTRKGCSNESLDKLADLFLLMADEETDREKQRILYEKCVMIYGYLEQAETVYSLDRRLKIERIKNRL